MRQGKLLVALTIVPLLVLVVLVAPLSNSTNATAMSVAVSELGTTTTPSTSVLVHGEPERSCTMIVVGKNATVDGSIIIARNEDYDGNWAKHLVVVPRMEHKAGETICSVYTGFCYPLPPVTHKYIAIPDWEWVNYQGRPVPGGVYDAAGINDAFVAITATVTISPNEKVEELDPFVPTGIGEDLVTTIVLLTANSAREAVKLVGHLVETYGASEGMALAVADPNEAWVVEVLSGRHWVAVRIPDDSYVVYGNEMRICEVNLTDTEHYMGSSDLVEFAVKNGLWNPEKGEPFCVAKVYGKEPNPKNYRRVWGVARLFSPSANYGPEQKWYPYFMKPDEKISVLDVMNALRDYYAGTIYDTRFNPSERGIGISRTVESHVIQLRGWLPVEVGGVMWVALSAPRASVYVPFYAGVTEIPSTYSTGTDEYDPYSAFWTYRTLANVLFSDPVKYEETIRSKLGEYEKWLVENQEHVDSTALKLYEVKPELAVEYLNTYCRVVAVGAQELARKVFAELMTNMAKSLK